MYTVVIVVPYELYELYHWGKVPNFMELYNVMELYVFFQSELLTLSYKLTIPLRQ